MVTVLWPGITIVVLTILAAVLLIAVGVAEIVLAVRLRKLIRGEIFMALAGLASVIAGILILLWPLPGALALTIALGAYALVSGILLLVVAWRLRRLARSGEAGCRAPFRPVAVTDPVARSEPNACRYRGRRSARV